MLSRYFLARIFSGNLDADEAVSLWRVCRKGKHSRSSFLTVRMYASWNHGTIEVHAMSWVNSEDIRYHPLSICASDIRFQTSQWHGILRRCSLNRPKAKVKQTRRTLWIYTTFPGILPSSSWSSKEPWLDRFLLSRIGTEMLTSHYVASMEAWLGRDVGFPTWTSDIRSAWPPEAWTILYIFLSTRL